MIHVSNILAPFLEMLPRPLLARLNNSSIARRLAHGSVWSLAGSVVARILVLLSMVLVARVLGQESFGHFGLIQATLGVAGMMAGLGINSTAARYVAQYAGSAPQRAGEVIGLLLTVSRVTVLIVAGMLVWGAVPLADHWLEAPLLADALRLGAIVMAVSTFRSVQVGVLTGLEQFKLVAKLNVLEGFGTLLGILLLSKYYGLDGAVVGMAFGGGLAWMIGHRWLRKCLAQSGIMISYGGLRRNIYILHAHALPSLMAGMVATPVLWLAMSLLARSASGYEEVALYNAAYQWHGPVIFVPMTVMTVMLPILVQEWESGRLQRFRKLILWVIFLMLLVSLPLVLVLSAMSHFIMSLYGEGFERGAIIFVLLMLAAPLHGISKIATSALVAMECAWWVLVANGFWGFVLVVLAYWLISDLGALGLAIAFTSAHVTMAFIKVMMVLVRIKMRAFNAVGVYMPRQ